MLIVLWDKPDVGYSDWMGQLFQVACGLSWEMVREVLVSFDYVDKPDVFSYES